MDRFAGEKCSYVVGKIEIIMSIEINDYWTISVIMEAYTTRYGSNTARYGTIITEKVQ